MTPDYTTNTTDPVQQAPQTEAQADPNTVADTATDQAQTASTDTQASADGAASDAAQSSTAATTTGATPGDAQSEINPSNALAGTAAAQPGGVVKSGMAADPASVKATPAQTVAATPNANAGVDAAPGVNVTVPANVPHPIVQLVTTQVADLRSVVTEVHKKTPTPFLDRALKDLQAFEEWVVQHFEELKRKL